MCALTLSVWCRSSIRAGTVYMRRDLNMALQQCVVFSGKASCASAITSRPRLRVCARACERGRKKRKEGGGRELRAGGNSCVLECVYPGGDP